jgi:hypothetical protein
MATIPEREAFDLNFDQPTRDTLERELLHKRFNRIEVWILLFAASGGVAAVSALWGLYDHLQALARACHLG